jgi:hypothetical protein
VIAHQEWAMEGRDAVIPRGTIPMPVAAPRAIADRRIALCRTGMFFNRRFTGPTSGQLYLIA